MKKRSKKKPKYLTVNVKGSDKLKYTVNVRIPIAFCVAEGLAEAVLKAVLAWQEVNLKADSTH